MSIPLEVSESQETIWDCDISTVLGRLNMANLDPIEHAKEPFGHDTGPTTSILSSALSRLLTQTHGGGFNSGEALSSYAADR